MVKVTGPTNPELQGLVAALRGKKEKIWKKIADKIEKPARRRPEMNVSRLSRITKKGDNIVIPGKVLGTGKIDFPVNVAALSFSDSAASKITAAGGKVLWIGEIVENKPKRLRLMV